MLNVAWSWLFFGLRSPGAAFIEIIILWLMIYATIRAFKNIKPLAGYLLIPYLAWVSFASLLNLMFWWLNR
jgi:tryptophan-rich sensory protein